MRGEQITASGGIRSSPTPDAALELIGLLQKRKSYIGWTPGLQHYMSALNFFLFRVGGPEKIPVRFLTPTRETGMLGLTHMISPKIVSRELEKRILKDPSEWNKLNLEKPSLTDTAILLQELMTTTAYTTDMREIVEWFKLAYRRAQITALIENVLNQQVMMLTTLRPRTSLKAAASRG